VGSSAASVIIESPARRRRPDPLNEFVSGDPVSETERLLVVEDLNLKLASG
jgi:hypothetical protein